MLDSSPTPTSGFRRPRPGRTAMAIGAVVALAAAAVALHRSPAVPHATAQATTAAGVPSSAESIVPVGPTGVWQLTFHDEFAGTQLDKTKWIPCVSAGWTAAEKRPCEGWGGELERYTPNNVTVSGGAAHLTAQRGPDGTYTSGAISTAEDAFGFNQPGYRPFGYRYGYFEARIRTPDEQGMWPAVWSMPLAGGGMGEMDLFELLSTPDDPKRLSMALHGKEPADLLAQANPVIPDIAQNYHVFGAEWEPDSLTWWVDGKVIMKVTGKPIPDRAHFPMANLAMGGQVGPPDPNQVRPLTMDIDYMRVFQLG